MSTNNRAESSRANGAKGQGPVTPEGRAVSSQNALKFGIYSKRGLLPSEDPAEYEALVESLRSSHNPGSLLEEICLARAADALWKLQRVRRAETATIELQQAQYHYSTDQKKWERYGGYVFANQLSLYSKEALDEHAPQRDAVVKTALSIPEDPEKFTRLTSNLYKEVDLAFKLFREEQSRRISSLMIERPAEVGVCPEGEAERES